MNIRSNTGLPQRNPHQLNKTCLIHQRRELVILSMGFLRFAKRKLMKGQMRLLNSSKSIRSVRNVREGCQCLEHALIIRSLQILILPHQVSATSLIL